MTDDFDIDDLLRKAVEGTLTGSRKGGKRSGRRRSTALATEHVGWMPESREARRTVRGKTQTSYWKARKVAEDSLVVRQIEPVVQHVEQTEAIAHQRSLELQVFGNNSSSSFHADWKPQVPRRYAKLDQRAFESNEQFLIRQETPGEYDGEEYPGHNPPEPKRGSSGKAALKKYVEDQQRAAKREAKAADFQALLNEFGDI
jgi:hypothetical protein